VRVWATAILLALLLLPLPLFSQQPGNVLLEPSEQIFCVLAALNAAGYDTGSNSSAADPAREQVRADMASKTTPVLPQIEKFYAEHRVPGDPGAELGQYLSLAVLLGPPPDFRPTVAEAELPPDAKDVVELLPLLRSFYAQADLLNLWAHAQPRYRAAVGRYTNDVRQNLVLADAYFRFPAGGYLGRTYTIYVDLLGVPEQVQARIYGENYYLVVTSSKEPKVSEIRHQYLHFILDPLAAKYAPEIHQKAELRGLAYQAPTLATDFKEDFPLLVTECLIRAAELRMDKRPKPEAEKSLNAMTASGLILSRYFYEALESFEQQEASVSIYYKTMILGINPRAEEKRLAGVTFTPKPTPSAVPSLPAHAGSAPASTPAGEEERLLDQGDNFFYRGRYQDAKLAFQTVLEKLDPKSERALFGMAVVASNTRKPDLAEEYFQKTLDAARSLRITTWSHIYLGRLYDLKGERQKALVQYHAASLTATAYPDALRAVQDGLARAFGSKEE
jgi:tetratricopeptide (TPR) repeat protein